MRRLGTSSLAALLVACRASAPTPPPAAPPAPVAPPTPVARVASPRPVAWVSLVAGNHFACGLRADETVWCWGEDTHGELGDGEPFEDRAEPRPVPGVTEVIQIAAHDDLACANTRGGAVWCWGAFSTGARTSPTRFPRTEALSRVQVSTESVFALSSAGLIRWRRSAREDDSAYGSSEVVELGPASRFRGIALGGDFACALLDGTDLRCWGGNGHGQLAERGARYRDIPDGAAPLTGVRDLVALEGHVCAFMERGPARCWGTGRIEGLFDDDVTESVLPSPRAALGDAVSLVIGSPRPENLACALSPEGRVTCSHSSPLTEEVDAEPPPPRVDALPLSGPARSIALTYSSMCAALRDGSVVCAVGDPYAWRSAPPRFALVPGLSNITDLFSEGGVICARSEAAPPRCWGDDLAWGLIARSTQTRFARPVARDDLGAVISLAAGMRHACVVERGGVVRCWGEGRLGQLGSGVCSERASPVEVLGAHGAAEVAVGTTHSCARMEDGTVRCWGDNTEAQLGDATAARLRAEPAAVPGLDHVTRIVARDAFTCALRDDGTVWCWGGANEGIYADALTTAHARPTQIRAE